MPRKSKAKVPASPSPVKQQQQNKQRSPTQAAEASPPPAAPAERKSPIHALTAIIDEHNASRPADERLELFVASSTPPRTPHSHAAAAPVATASFAAPDAPDAKRGKKTLRSVASAPEELYSLALHHAESDDSLFNKSLSSMQQQQQQQKPQEATTISKQSLLLAPANTLKTAAAAASTSTVTRVSASEGRRDDNKTKKKSETEEEQDADNENNNTTENDANDSSSIRGSFVPILTFTRAEQVLHPEGTASASRWNQLMRLFGGLVLVSRVNWQHLLLWIASYVYVPLIAAVCVTTANALLAVAAIAILPVIEYSSDDDEFLLDGGRSSAAAAAAGTTEVVASYLYSFFHFTQSGEIGAHHHHSSPSSDAAFMGSGPLLSTTAGAGAGATAHHHPSTVMSVIGVFLTATLSLLIILGTAVSGYKLSAMVADAFLDSCRIVVDRRSGFTLLFYSLYCDLVKIFALGSRYVAVFVIFLVGMPGWVVYSIMSGGWCSAVARRPAFVAAFLALMLEVGWLIFQIVRFLLRMTKAQKNGPGQLGSPMSPLSPVSPQSHRRRFSSPLVSNMKTKTKMPSSTASMSDAEDVERFGEMLKRTPLSALPSTVTTTKTDLAAQLGVWWARKIPKMRKRGFFLLFLTAVAVTIGSGLLNGIIAMVEGFLYVSTLHLAAHVAARGTLFIRAVRVSLKTVVKDPAAMITSLIIGPVFVGVAVANFVRFGLLGLVQVPVLVLALCSIASHAEDLTMGIKDSIAGGGGGGGGHNLVSSVFSILSRVSLMNPRRSYDYGAHWKMARYVRILLRVVIASFTFAVTVASTYTAVQAIQFRFINYQASLLQVEPLSGKGEDGLKVFTDSFQLYLKKGGAGGGNQSSSSSSSPSCQHESNKKTKKSRLYRGMCQRRWFSMSGNEDDTEEVDARVFQEEQRQQQEAAAASCDGGGGDVNNNKKKTPPSYSTNDNELHFGDMAFFSMLSYVAPMNELQSLRLLLDFYRHHRRGAKGWAFVSPMSEVWDPLRAELLREAALLRKQQQHQQQEDESTPSPPPLLTAAEIAEARELVRWSQHHVAQSLRPPFFHFKRKRGAAAAAAMKKKKEKNKQHEQQQQEEDDLTSFEDNLFVMRGTELALASDLFQNMIIFSDVFLIEQLAHLVPGVGLLPLEFIRDLVSATNFVARVPDAFFYHAHMKRYMRACQILSSARIRRRQWIVRQRKSSQSLLLPRDNYACVGHSLGGVSCELAAPPLRIPAIALSAPGTLFLSTKFGITAEATEAFVTNLVVSNDVIPLIGSTNGEVHNVNCEHDAAMVCHSVQLSLWRALTHCEALRASFSEDLAVSYSMNVNQVTVFLQLMNSYVEKILGVKLEFQKF